MQPKRKQFDQPKHETPCQFGERCNMFPLGKCPFMHEQSMMVASLPPNNSMMADVQREDTSQSFKNVLFSLCFNYLMNRSEGEECGKLHEFTQAKNIKKIFHVDN
jgi:hypothetical protein